MMRRFGFLAAMLTLSATFAFAASPNLDLGQKPSIGLFQPRVTVDIASEAGGSSLGPTSTTFLLDTAANGIVIFPPATTQLIDNGFQNEGTYEEAGVSGTSIFQVSSPYHLTYRGNDNIPQTMDDVRFMSAERAVDPTGLMGMNGIVGISSMVGKVTTLDNTSRTGAPTLSMGVGFTANLPSSNTTRFTIPFGKAEFLQHGDGPFPTWHADLPTVELIANNGDNTYTTPIVFDTGAQRTIISEAMATALGLDANGDGDFTDDATSSVQISGATGGLTAPVLSIESMSLPTDQGFNLTFNDAEVIVLDIDPSIAGVLGADFISGDGGLDPALLGGGGDLGNLLGGLDLGGLLGGGDDGGLGDLGDLLGGGGTGGLGDLLGGLGGLLGGGGTGGLEDLLGGLLGQADDGDPSTDPDPTDPLAGLEDLLGGGGLGGLEDILGGLGGLGGLLGGGGADPFASFPLESVFDRVHIDLREGNGQLVYDLNPEISLSVLNGDHVFDSKDIDDLTDAIDTSNGRYDLNADGIVDGADRDSLIGDVFGTVAGDADLDGDVDFQDFLALANGFGQENGWAGGDFDGDGQTAFLDFLALANSFGQTSAAADTQSVPEPVSGLLLLVGVTGLLSLRRRR